jgi:hypothetical protein
MLSVIRHRQVMIVPQGIPTGYVQGRRYVEGCGWHPPNFEKSLLETIFHHSYRFNFHDYKRKTPSLICSSFAPGYVALVASNQLITAKSAVMLHSLSSCIWQIRREVAVVKIIYSVVKDEGKINGKFTRCSSDFWTPVTRFLVAVQWRCQRIGCSVVVWPWARCRGRSTLHACGRLARVPALLSTQLQVHHVHVAGVDYAPPVECMQLQCLLFCRWRDMLSHQIT